MRGCFSTTADVLVCGLKQRRQSVQPALNGSVRVHLLLSLRREAWPCPQCANMNSKHVLHCTVATCAVRRPLVQQWREGDYYCKDCGNHPYRSSLWCQWVHCHSNEWTRPHCSNLNYAARKDHRRWCRRPRDWVCPGCSVVNSVVHGVCQTTGCGHAKPSEKLREPIFRTGAKATSRSAFGVPIHETVSGQIVVRAKIEPRVLIHYALLLPVLLPLTPLQPVQPLHDSGLVTCVWFPSARMGNFLAISLNLPVSQ